MHRSPFSRLLCVLVLILLIGMVLPAWSRASSRYDKNGHIESSEETFLSDHGLSDMAMAEAALNAPAFNVTLALAAANELDSHVGGEWGPVIDWPEIPVSAANLPDGRVVTWASNRVNSFPGNRPEFAYASVWDPSDNSFISVNHNSHDMFCAHQVMTPEGEVFVAGGRNQGNSPWTSTFDHNTDSWTVLPNMNRGRWYPTSVALANGEVFTMIGSGGGDTGEIYVPGDDWYILNGMDFSVPILNYSSSSYVERNWWPMLALAPNGKIFHAGPTPKMHWLDTAGNGTVTQIGSEFHDWYGKHGGFVMYDEGKLMNAGGWTSGSTVASTDRVMTVDINGYNPVVNEINSMNSPRKFQNAVMLPTGEVLIVGGNTSGLKFNDSGTVLEPEAWNPETGQWTLLNPMDKPRNYHSVALLLPDATVFSGGGGLCGGCSANHMNGQVYSPPYLFNSDGSAADRPEITDAPNTVNVGDSAVVTTDGPIDKFTIIKLSSTTHAVNTDLRFLELPSTNLEGNDYQLDFHSNPNVLTPGYWYLFAVDTNGVPSVAKTFKVINIEIKSSNLALDRPVSQSSTFGGGEAEQAVDGDVDGHYPNDSVSQTDNELNPWWEVDLQSIQQIDSIRIWNRTDCCAANLSDFYLFVAEQPFGNQSLTEILAREDVNINHYPGTAENVSDMIIDQPGRYVRIQLNGQNHLNLAEVEIFSAQTPSSLNITPPISTPKEVNTTITFDAGLTQSELQYKWSFGDGSPETPYSEEASIDYAYSIPGRYTVQLTVKNGSGETQKVQFIQSIYGTPTVNRPSRSTTILYESESRSGGSDRVWNVNPDNNSVSITDAQTTALIAEIPVGTGPATLALTPNQTTVWVTNKDSHTISVIDTNTLSVVDTISLPLGSAPHGIAFDPDGSAAYLTLERLGMVYRLNPTTRNIDAQLPLGSHLRQISVSADGENLYVSRFVTPPVPGEGSASPNVGGVGGELIKVETANFTIETTILLGHNNVTDSEKSARGIPNYLGAFAIAPDNQRGYLPSKQDNILRGTLRDGQPLLHDNTVRAISSYVDIGSDQEDLNGRIDHDNSSLSSAAAFGRYGNYLFVALQTSREVGIVDAYGREEIGRFQVGRAPQGLVVSEDGLTLYVHNFMDRSVSAYDLSTLINTGTPTVSHIGTEGVVGSERLSVDEFEGKQIFYDAFDARLSFESYMSCASCHQDGGQDGRVWDFTGFGEGLRNTITLDGHGGPAHGPLHWSGNFDEVHDFEGQIRNFAGGTGLMTNGDFLSTSDPFGPQKAGLSDDLDKLAVYVNSLTTILPSPDRNPDGSLTAAGSRGRDLFIAQSCTSCHSGPVFTDSPSGQRHDIGTLKPSSGNRLFGSLDGLDTPSLIGVRNTAPYLHDGSAPTLADAVNAHSGVSLTQTEMDDLSAYLMQIDSSTVMSEPDGGLTLQGRSDYTAEITAKIYAAGGTTPLATLTLNSDTIGTFALPELLPGSYDLAVKIDGYLQTIAGTSLPDGSFTVSFGELKAGDANGDNEVTALDFSMLAGAFNTFAGDANYNIMADFNADDSVTALDFSLLASNFNQAGDEPNP
ncbi:MAG: galactose oxidase-like domain-containing protein [Chloroflexota bacterium]